MDLGICCLKIDRHGTMYVDVHIMLLLQLQMKAAEVDFEWLVGLAHNIM